MLIQAQENTNWFRLGIVVTMTLVSFWFIKEAFAKPFVEWKAYNEIRAAEINAIIGQDETPKETSEEDLAE